MLTTFRQNRLIFVFCAGCAIFSLLFAEQAWAAKKKSKTHQLTAKSAIFSNSTTVKRLFGKNSLVAVVPASTTKVMTALLVLENLPLDRVVTVSRRATLTQPSKINLRRGERYKVSDLLYAMLLNSANDASVVLAEAVAGSEANFVKKMNQRAKALGTKRTKFANCHGLPTEATQYTTAYDMYLIFREALKFPFFKEGLKYKYKKIFSQEGRGILLKSHNKLLWKSWGQHIYGKTGYTRKAKSCFVGYTQRGKDILIIAVFGCSKRWDDIKYIVSKYGKTR